MSQGFEAVKVEGGWYILNGIDSKHLDLEKTFNCGQCFRWKRIKKNVYKGVIEHKVVGLAMINGVLHTTVSDEKDVEALANFLALDVNYARELEKLDIGNDWITRKAIVYGEGIRLLRQDPWETLVAFVISQRNSITRISKTMEEMSKIGEAIEVSGENWVLTMNDFPTPKVLNDAIQNESFRKKCGLGYRDSYILGITNKILTGDIELERMREYKYSYQVIEELQKLPGVGNKVANCVALFAYGKLDAFPIDVWVRRMMERYEGVLNKNAYGKIAGLMQQYLYYYAINHKEELEGV